MVWDEGEGNELHHAPTFGSLANVGSAPETPAQCRPRTTQAAPSPRHLLRRRRSRLRRRPPPLPQGHPSRGRLAGSQVPVERDTFAPRASSSIRDQKVSPFHSIRHWRCRKRQMPGSQEFPSKPPPVPVVAISRKHHFGSARAPPHQTATVLLGAPPRHHLLVAEPPQQLLAAVHHGLQLAQFLCCRSGGGRCWRGLGAGDGAASAANWQEVLERRQRLSSPVRKGGLGLRPTGGGHVVTAAAVDDDDARTPSSCCAPQINAAPAAVTSTSSPLRRMLNHLLLLQYYHW
jgi:hypothetical protein